MMSDVENTPLSDDYKTLKKEAVEYAHTSLKSFHEMAIRLKKIKDNKLYRDEYSSFRIFIDREFEGVRSTAYNYLGIMNHYDVQALGHNFHFSKLLHTLPLLNSNKLTKRQKTSIRKKTVQAINDGKSENDIKKMVGEWKVQYNLIEPEEQLDRYYPRVESEGNTKSIVVQNYPLFDFDEHIDYEIKSKILETLLKDKELLKLIKSKLESKGGN